MKSKIMELIENNTYQSSEWVASKILALLRQNGWLHKDGSHPGLQVTRECPDCATNKNPYSYGSCVNKNCMLGKITSPFTVGEALEMFEGMVKEIRLECTHCSQFGEYCKECWVNRVLTTKDGGVVSLKEE